jgi:hypothetical protein
MPRTRSGTNDPLPLRATYDHPIVTFFEQTPARAVGWPLTAFARCFQHRPGIFRKPAVAVAYSVHVGKLLDLELTEMAAHYLPHKPDAIVIQLTKERTADRLQLAPLMTTVG